jgi:hypothetical protein
MFVVTCMLVVTHVIVAAGVLALVHGSVVIRVLHVYSMVAVSGVIAVINRFAVLFRHGVDPGRSWSWSVSFAGVGRAVVVGRHWLLPYRRIGCWMHGRGDLCQVRTRHVAIEIA